MMNAGCGIPGGETMYQLLAHSRVRHSVQLENLPRTLRIKACFHDCHSMWPESPDSVKQLDHGCLSIPIILSFFFFLH